MRYPPAYCGPGPRQPARRQRRVPRAWLRARPIRGRRANGQATRQIARPTIRPPPTSPMWRIATLQLPEPEECRDSQRASIFRRLHWLFILRLVVHTQQLFFVEYHLFPAAAGQVVEARQLDRVDRARLFTHAAVDTTQLVNHEALRILLAIGPGALGRNDVDASRRAG